MNSRALIRRIGLTLLDCSQSTLLLALGGDQEACRVLNSLGIGPLDREAIADARIRRRREAGIQSTVKGPIVLGPWEGMVRMPVWGSWIVRVTDGSWWCVRGPDGFSIEARASSLEVAQGDADEAAIRHGLVLLNAKPGSYAGHVLRPWEDPFGNLQKKPEGYVMANAGPLRVVLNSPLGWVVEVPSKTILARGPQVGPDGFQAAMAALHALGVRTP